MKNLLNLVVISGVLMFGGGAIQQTPAADGSVEMQFAGSNVLLKVDGDKDDDWWLQSSTNLTTWTTLTNVGTVLSGNVTNAPWRIVGSKAGGPIYYRAQQTYGFYDTNLLRVITLSYTQASFTTLSNQLVAARTYSTNVYFPQLTLNNGATNVSVGARFKGNTSFTSGGVKKSLNIELDYVVTNADVMGYSTFNLNNAAGDVTLMREPLYFSVLAEYACSPKACLAQLYMNSSNRGVYSLSQQENSELIKEHFPSAAGDRWRTPNPPTASAIYAFGYLGNTNISTYATGTTYDLRTDNAASTNISWMRLINAIYVLNNTGTNQFRDTIENVFGVDSWLWFLAVENLFVDDDSYWNKGADYSFYYEVESGRIFPVEHDGNEAFITDAMGGISYSLSPLYGDGLTTRPLLYQFLRNNELRQRYLAHMRTVIAEYFNPGVMTRRIDHFMTVSSNAIASDPLRGYTGMTSYYSAVTALKTYVTNRYNSLQTYAELVALPPTITWVSAPSNTVYATNIPVVTAKVTSSGTGINSVWLYFRDKSYGRFTARQMFDDGAHGDGPAGDGVFGAVTTNYPAGNKIHFYVEARAANSYQSASFAPARAEKVTYNYKVALTTAASTSVVINEFMAANTSTLADPQGEFDDWIELRNLTESAVNLTGFYLTDEPSNPRKWAFPAGTTIAANGYLLVWADENGTATPGLHANFKLSASSEQIYLVDTDANHNQVLDAITFGLQTTDVSYGRTAADAEVWSTMTPTPNAANQ